MNNKAKETMNFPGFYEISGFSNYAISRNGKVINKNTMKFLKGGRNPAGYFNFTLDDDFKYRYTWGRHRLLAFVFKHPNCNTDSLVVNHKNGIKGDDWLDNLEWVTYQGNAEHAGFNGLTNKCQPISVRNIDTGFIVKYPSIVECARTLGMSKDAINYRVKCGETKIFPERLQYRLSHEDCPWFTPEDIERKMLENGTSRKVMVRNVLTNEVNTFDKLTDLSLYLDVPPPTLTLWLKHSSQPVLPGFIQIKLAEDKNPWREVFNPYLELDAYTGSRSVKVINDKTGEFKIFSSCTECCFNMNLKTTTLNYRLKFNGNKVFSDGYRYIYYSDSFNSQIV